jgi:hypothetical protein
MINSVILDKNKHKHTHIKTERGAKYGEAINYVPVIADEIAELVLEYPVYFIKNNQTGQFELFALTGFEKGQNLFLNGNLWKADYIPLHIQRQPFMLAVGERDQTKLTVTINENHSRVNTSEGELLFDESLEPTLFLQSVSDKLIKLMDGEQRTRAFIDDLLKNNLIEAVQLNITKSNGNTQSYKGLYSISSDALQTLCASSLSELHKMGYLQACHLILASSGHIKKLIRWLHELDKSV